MSGGSSGLGRRGGNSAIDEVDAETGRDWWRLMRPFDSGGVFTANTTRIRFAGQSQVAPGDTGAGVGSAVTLSGAGFGSDRYFAIPEWFTRGGTIKRLCMLGQQASQAVAARFTLHVYSNGVCDTAPFVGFPYPDRLLLSGLEYAPATQGVLVGAGGFHIWDSLTDYQIDDQALLWFVLRCNAAFLGSGSKWTMQRGVMPGWMGFTIGAATQPADAGTLGCGYYHSTTYVNGADATFPQSAPSAIPCGTTTTNADVPAIGYGFAGEL